MELILVVQLLAIFAVAVALILSGVPIGYGLSILCIAITIMIVGTDRLPLLGIVAYGGVTHPSLVAIPLFLLTAELLASARMSDGAFDVLARWLRRVPSSLAVVSTALSTLFSAIIGSSAGNTALMGKVALRPMLTRGYDPAIATGVLVAGGALGALIPPSTLFILYGVVTETSVGKLMIAGLVPGLLMSFFMVLFVVFHGRRRPPKSSTTRQDGASSAPQTPSRLNTGSRGSAGSSSTALMDAPVVSSDPIVTREHRRLHSVLRDLRVLFPIVFLVAFLSYGMYAGIATPNEVAGFGAAGALLMVASSRRITATGLKGALLSTARTSSMLLFLVVMASYLGRLFAFMGVGPALVEFVTDLGWSPLAVVFMMCLVLFVMGTVFDSAAIILIMGPLAHTLMMSLGQDAIWWGVIFVISMEIALITPPFGINLFVLKGIAPDIPMKTINKGAWMFVGVHTVGLVVCILWPGLVMWAPNAMG